MGSQKNMKKKSKARSRLLLSAVLLSASLLALLSVAGFFGIQEVTVVGNDYYTKEQIEDFVVEGSYKRNTIYVYFRYRYLAQPEIPFVDTFEVKITSPHSVSIRVYEKNIVGYIRYLGKNVYFDKDGIVVESSDEVMEGVPMIRGLSFDHLVLHQALDVKNPEVFGTILGITQLLDKYELKPDEIRFGSNGDLYLQLKDVKVALGAGEHLDEKVARLKQLEADLVDKSGTLHMEAYTDESTHISLETSQ